MFNDIEIFMTNILAFRKSMRSFYLINNNTLNNYILIQI